MGNNVGLILIAFVVLSIPLLVNPTSVTICFDLPKNTSTEVGCDETPGGVLNFELGTDVRPEVSNTPITKPEKTQICYLYQNHSFL